MYDQSGITYTDLDYPGFSQMREGERERERRSRDM